MSKRVGVILRSVLWRARLKKWGVRSQVVLGCRPFLRAHPLGH